ncbi:MAG: ATP-grasp domain-containing protein [Bacteroidota bacterium]
MNILITSAGRRVSLINYFKQEIKNVIGKNSKIFTTDLIPELSSACITSDNSFKVGKFKDDDYMDKLLKICIENQIKILIPTLDPELALYSNNRDRFKLNGIELLVSDIDFIKKCRDKRKTNSFFEERGIAVPSIIDRKNPSFPIFIKPIDGSSSKNLYFIDEPAKLSKFLIENDNLMWMEYLSKEEFTEYTIDLYYNRQGRLCCVVPRIRIAVRGGEVNKGITHKDPYLISFIREHLGEIEGVRGCITLQIFYGKKNKSIYGIEINPRFGGGYPLSYLAGANYPKWIIEEYWFEQEIGWFDGWEDKLLLLRYDHELIVHDFNY